MHDGKAVRFATGKGKNWTCDLTAYTCLGPDTIPIETPAEVPSPDGKWVAFTRRDNLWVRNVASGADVQLTGERGTMELLGRGERPSDGGGFASTDAMLRYPDFFKVAVSSSGNHDNRSYDYTWGEKYQGLLTHNPDGTDSFDSQSNWRLAKNLKGKLLLMYGTLDDNVPPNNTLEVVNALIKANKDFDMLVLPNRNHGLGESYVTRRTWDYFVRNLLGVRPPSQYPLTVAGATTP